MKQPEDDTIRITDLMVRTHGFLTWVCPQCGAGCGTDVHADGDGAGLALPPILCLVKLWHGEMLESKTPNKWPPHTVMVRSVKLTELVYSYDE